MNQNCTVQIIRRRGHVNIRTKFLLLFHAMSFFFVLRTYFRINVIFSKSIDSEIFEFEIFILLKLRKESKDTINL